MKRGITLRTNRRGRRFVLNFQIGYDSSGSDDENDDPSEPKTPPSTPEEPKLQALPPKTEERRVSYGKITSYEQWLERERQEQRRITNSRLRR